MLKQSDYFTSYVGNINRIRLIQLIESEAEHHFAKQRLAAFGFSSLKIHSPRTVPAERAIQTGTPVAA
jgi:hypothetical protein